jgi:hypothetical protein
MSLRVFRPSQRAKARKIVMQLRTRPERMRSFSTRRAQAVSFLLNGGVYEAWDRGLHRRVAFQVMLSTSAPDHVLRFRLEVETAVAIPHPNIVPITDVGESSGRPFSGTRSSHSVSRGLALDGYLRFLGDTVRPTEGCCMSAEIKPGALVSIPCRACGKLMPPFTVDLGGHRLKCLRCNRHTRVSVMAENGRLRIRSELDPEPAAGNSP